MGRSQVLRNQRLGRPGTKGRGGRGNNSGRSRPNYNNNSRKKHVVVGDNSWRFTNNNDSSEINAAADDQDGVLQLEELGNDAYYGDDTDQLLRSEYELETNNNSHDDRNKDDSNNFDSDFILDVSLLSRCLTQLSTAERLGIKPHLAAAWDEKYPPTSTPKRSVAEMTLLKAPQQISDPIMDENQVNSIRINNDHKNNSGNQIKNEKKEITVKEEEEEKSSNKVTNEISMTNESDEENLDDWLDSVIEDEETINHANNESFNQKVNEKKEIIVKEKKSNEATKEASLEDDSEEENLDDWLDSVIS